MAAPEAEYVANHGEGRKDSDDVRVIIKTPSDERKSKVPVMFERSAKSWWNPKFDSEILENEFQKRSFSQFRRRFRYALIYIAFAYIVWCLFFFINRSKKIGMENDWLFYVIGGVVFIILTLLIFIFTFLPVYRRLTTPTSLFLSICLCISCLLNFCNTGKSAKMTEVGTFTSSVEIILMMYTVIPLPLYFCVALGVVYSGLFEVLTGILMKDDDICYHVARILLHFCIHFIGIYICVMTQVRRRSTFLKVGQAILSRRDLEIEKDLKKTMINSLMPQKVAEEVISSREEKGGDADDNDDPKASPKKRHSKAVSPTRGQITFRNFHMSQMNDVSILFADIVGFTKMSSNKTAQHLVSLLNGLFGDFDIICAKTGCEKICTLGDCYYSVSGCPDARQDHAKCCVEMGLSMCVAIQEFDVANNEEVNMRVGVHTGMVLCGLVGTRRFKFDVWSHDVNIANTMESDGQAGKVHISDSTYQFVKDDYEVEPGEEVEDIRKHKTLIEYYNKEKQGYDIKHIQDEDTIKTWFITARKNGIPLTTPLRKMEETGEENIHVQISNDENDTTKVNVDENNEEDPSSKNHKDGQAEGLATTALLTKRDMLASSNEELSAALGDDVKKQLHAQAVQPTEVDREIVTCMRKDSQVEEYLYNPPINKCTLNFRHKEIESQYRDHYLDDKYQAHQTSTLSRPRFSALLDVIISFIFLIVISVCCFMTFESTLLWFFFFPIAFIIEIAMILPLIVNLCMASEQSILLRMGNFVLLWYPRHITGAVVSSLPVAAIYCNLQCSQFDEGKTDLMFCLILVVALLHYCNFTMLISWMKSCLATMAGVILLLMILIGICHTNISDTTTSSYNTTTEGLQYVSDAPATMVIDIIENSIDTDFNIFDERHQPRFEIILNLFLLLILIWFLNREFEINYRLTFHGDMLAEEDKRKTQEEKDQADWLLHNIIPEHVADEMKKTSQYCKNHDEVGVVFAKIINYDSFYDESYEGGKEYLRVLNEMMGDFEDLFDDPRFKDVEKIKTIGSCLMIASGLNPNTRLENKNPKAHLYALMDFTVELLKKLDDFNAEIFNFDFEMAIGFNSGPVTAGVIGTTKLLYDIWGDTVNVSSRMYSTGVAGKIQVTEECSQKIDDMFNFEYRGQTFVKGKGDLNTYILAEKKAEATWE